MSNFKILIVDDSRSIVKMNSKIAQSLLPDAEIISFLNPKEAIETIKNEGHTFKIAMLDYNMKDLNGIELAEALVSEKIGLESYEQITIVSANIQAAVKAKATEKGIHFIDKPLKVDELKKFFNLKGVL